MDMNANLFQQRLDALKAEIVEQHKYVTNLRIHLSEDESKLWNVEREEGRLAGLRRALNIMEGQ